MANIPEIKLAEAVKGLIVTASLAVNVTQAQISQVSADLAQEYGQARSREIEAEIARRIRNRS